LIHARFFNGAPVYKTPARIFHEFFLHAVKKDNFLKIIYRFLSIFIQAINA